MVDGTLAEANFRYYVVQDALYLRDFAHALRLLSERTDVPVEDYRRRIRAYTKDVEEAELDLHNGFFKEWNILVSADDNAEQMPNCLLYTSFMLRVVATRPFEEGLAVLVPCFWVYLHVGKRMLQLRRQLGGSYVSFSFCGGTL